MKAERLDKILAGTGVYSRSEARRLIQRGSVLVDGRCVREPDCRVERSSEIVAEGERLDTSEYVYYMMNKPAGYVSAAKGEGSYPPVTELLPAPLRKRGLFCAGRLDADVTGLLLLTDDGGYAHRVMSPRQEIEKTYEVRTDGPLSPADEETLAAGVTLRSGVRYRPARLRIREEDPCLCLVTVTEGKFHEVKNLIAVLGRHVAAMRRISVGGLSLDETLSPGAIRALDRAEAERVFI